MSYLEDRNTYYKELVEHIKEHLISGGIVIMATYTKAWQYDKNSHAELFKIGLDCHPYVLHGKHWLDVSGCSFKFYTYAKDKTNVKTS